MKREVMTFQQALELAHRSRSRKKHLLLGNGFSISLMPDKFNYYNLYNNADLDPAIKKVFKTFDTVDFEIVMQKLIDTLSVLKVYRQQKTNLYRGLEQSLESIKKCLVDSISKSHPKYQSEITDKQFSYCRDFLSCFETIYTLNYDLVLYWVLMKFLGTELEIDCDDGFRRSSQSQILEWDDDIQHKRNIYFLHGALHLYNTFANIEKIENNELQGKLIEQITENLNKNYLPLFISEGSSSSKLSKIRNHAYLHTGLRSIANINGSLFVFGHSLSDNDEHIFDKACGGKITNLFISLYGGISANKSIINKAERLMGNYSVQIYFYDSESANVWGNKS